MTRFSLYTTSFSMDLVFIAFAALSGSFVTFYSGFGLGTVLLPIFGMVYPPLVAIAATALVHLLNNLFKFQLTYRNLQLFTVRQFAITAVPSAFLGAYLVSHLQNVNFIVGLFIVIFAVFEAFDGGRIFKSLSRQLWLGGLLSGFVGGLTGHQGALRSAFLINVATSKEAFIANGVAIACLVDFSRLLVYGGSWTNLDSTHALTVGVAVLAGFLGAYLGNKFLPKVNLRGLRLLVMLLMILSGIKIMFS